MKLRQGPPGTGRGQTALVLGIGPSLGGATAPAQERHGARRGFGRDIATEENAFGGRCAGGRRGRQRRLAPRGGGGRQGPIEGATAAGGAVLVRRVGFGLYRDKGEEDAVGAEGEKDGLTGRGESRRRHGGHLFRGQKGGGRRRGDLQVHVVVDAALGRWEFRE